MEIMDKEEQLAGFRRLTNSYMQEIVPSLRNQINSKDDLLKSITRGGSEESIELVRHM